MTRTVSMAVRGLADEAAHAGGDTRRGGRRKRTDLLISTSDRHFQTSTRTMLLHNDSYSRSSSLSATTGARFVALRAGALARLTTG